MDSYYRAFVKVQGSHSNPKLINGSSSKDELEKWCEETIAQFRVVAIRARIDKERPGPREKNVWEWSRPKAS